MQQVVCIQSIPLSRMTMIYGISTLLRIHAPFCYIGFKGFKGILDLLHLETARLQDLTEGYQF